MNVKESLIITQIKKELKDELREELRQEFKQELQENFNNTIVKITNLQNELNEVKQQLQYTIEKRNEIFYQKHLEKLLNGTHKTTKHGITDIFTKDAIYEIKGWKNYKSCFGQLKSYYVGNEDKRLCAAFYGEINEEQKQKIIELFSQNKIEVYEITESYDGVISLKHLNEFIKENNQILNFVINNVSYTKGDYVELKDLCQLFFENKSKVGVKEKSKLRKEIEKIIKITYPQINNECQRTTIDGKPFQGWIDLKFKG
jgi:hypothetical protein